MVYFIILHYLVFEETKKCVESILDNIQGEKKIIIVDNHSSNNSVHKLEQCFAGNQNVSIVKNDKNNGYADGINTGFAIARKQNDAEFIVCMNNDMEILQADFCDQLKDAYRKELFDVLGPDIVSTSTGKHQNPEKDQIRTISQVDEHLADLKQIQKKKTALLIKGVIKSIKPLRNTYYYIKKSLHPSYVNHICRNVTLHGSCLIYSKRYFSDKLYALNPITFLYCESQILDYECLRDGRKTVYYPLLQVLHHEDAATDAVHHSYYEKMIKKCERVTESLLVFKELMLNDLETTNKQ